MNEWVKIDNQRARNKLCGTNWATPEPNQTERNWPDPAVCFSSFHSISFLFSFSYNPLASRAAVSFSLMRCLSFCSFSLATFFCSTLLALSRLSRAAMNSCQSMVYEDFKVRNRCDELYEVIRCNFKPDLKRSNKFSHMQDNLIYYLTNSSMIIWNRVHTE